VEPAETPDRYRMLEPIRYFAEKRLDESKERETIEPSPGHLAEGQYPFDQIRCWLPDGGRIQQMEEDVRTFQNLTGGPSAASRLDGDGNQRGGVYMRQGEARGEPAADRVLNVFAKVSTVSRDRDELSYREVAISFSARVRGDCGVLPTGIAIRPAN